MIESNPKSMKQWISATKDSVFIFEDLLYYGEIDPIKDNELLDQQAILAKLDSIPLSYLKSFQIDHEKNVTTLEYGKNSDLTVLIRWENLQFLNEFKAVMLKRLC